MFGFDSTGIVDVYDIMMRVLLFFTELIMTENLLNESEEGKMSSTEFM